jgi:hypothetical protein
MNDPTPRATGRCQCGGVQFEVRGPLRDVIVCHCGQCRRIHGHAAAFTSAASDDVVFHTDSTLTWYASSERALRGFCAECGASLFWEPLGEGRLGIAAGSLDAPTGLKTTRHIFVDHAGDYYEITDDLPRDGGSRTSG